MDNKRPHGIMFHHFCNDKHVKGQGAISAKEFENILDYLSTYFEILNADEWKHKALQGNLRENQICITFDDTLKCQYDIAYPVLKSRGITAFWFVFSSILEGDIEMVEIYRHFRTSKFQDIEEFYSAFFKLIVEENQTQIKIDIEREIENFNSCKHLEEFTFYTRNDRLFRYLRDIVLKPEKYNKLMTLMLDKYNYNIEKNKDLLWMSCENIKELYDTGNVIGMHSHTHPTFLASFSYQEQLSEYKKCKETLYNVIGNNLDCMSHPCNSYNSDTLKILSEIGIKLGFRANMTAGYTSLYEMPREDHTNVLKAMMAQYTV